MFYFIFLDVAIGNLLEKIIKIFVIEYVFDRQRCNKSIVVKILNVN
jgi:hypothetical protein